MRTNRADLLFLLISILAFLTMSVGFLLMKVVSLVYLPGIFVWSGLLIGVVFQVVLVVRRRRFYHQSGVKAEKRKRAGLGVFTFASNRLAMVADILLLISVGAVVIAYICTKGIGWSCYIAISVAVFTFCLHCILNGRVFYYVVHFPKIRHQLKQRNQKT